MATMESLIGLVNRIQRACTALGDYGGGDSTFSSLWDALPSAAVVGGQSSGKSSVLESIVGRDFLPRGSGIVTRRPLVLQLHKTEGRQEEYAEFGHLPRRRFTDFALVRKEIADETDRITGKSKQISPIPIHLSIYSPHVVNLTLIDLPGLTKIAVEGQSETIVEDIENMVRLYVEKPNSIILAISPANQDIATSDAIKLAKEVDPTGERTFGVLTKLDLMDKGTNALDVLEGRAYKLQHPWVGIVNRSQADINKNTDMMYARRREREYFATSPDYGHLASKMGSEYLAKLLSQHLESVIKAKIPGITSLINKGIDEMEAELDRLGRPIAVDAGLGLKMRDAHRCDLGQKCRCAMRNANAHASRTRCAQGKQLAELLDEDPSLMSKRQDIAKQLQLYKSARVIIVHSIMEIEDWAASSSDSDVTAPDSDNDESYALPKLQFRKDISKARWKEELGMAEIVSNKGKLWTTTGIVRGGKIYSFLEDTLFLAEIGALHLLDDEDKCIPLVDIYKKVSEGVGGSSWESFEVYRHLKSLGYIIKRRGVCWSMKSAKSEESSCIMEVTNLFSSMGINEESKRLFFDVYSPNSKFRKSNPGNPIFILCVNGGNPPTKKDIEDLDGQCEGIPLKFCYVEHGRVSFISFNKIELPVIP